MKLIGTLITIMLMATVLAACTPAGKVKESEQGAAVEERGTGAGPGEAGAGGAQATPLPGEGQVQVYPLDDPNSILAERVIYFDYDKSEIKNEYQQVLSAHAQFLASHPDVSVTLEGHTDERGSREYNIALGERRAEAVRRLLLFQGASDNQIQTVSYGEEQPAEPGHNAEAWAKNRRVEIVYKR
jgi:peptidoglycan-associated lipoprotein